MAKLKRTNASNGPQNTTQKNKDRATRAKRWCSGRVGASCATSNIRRVDHVSHL